MALEIPESCQEEGNADLYGIGVRAGLYAQWVATLLSTIFDPKEEGTFRIANLIIQTAIFLGLCTQSGPGESLIGALVTQYLLCGSLSSLTGDGIGHCAHFSGILRLLFYTAMAAYGCWFWFTGIDVMARPGCPEIAFFGEITICGPFRTVGKVVSVAGLVVCVVLDGYSVYATFQRFKHGFEEAFKSPPKTRPKIEISLLILSMGLIAISIFLVEHLIEINQIKGVGVNEIESVGQFIPLLAGGLGCAMTLWKIVAHRLFLRKRCWYLFGCHL